VWLTEGMNSERQVASLELAKKLKELGAKQESYFWWSAWQDHSPAEHVDCHELHWEVTDEHGGSIAPRIAAFTVSELGEVLPAFITIGEKNANKRFKLYLAKNEDGEHFVEYQEWGLGANEAYELLVQRSAETEADARAKMLIHLLENHLVEPVDLVG
jgi:hypothetical protein